MMAHILLLLLLMVTSISITLCPNLPTKTSPSGAVSPIIIASVYSACKDTICRMGVVRNAGMQ